MSIIQPAFELISSRMEKPNIWASFDHPPASTFCKGNLAILGDAAHASTLQQGAVLARLSRMLSYFPVYLEA
jgi:2-polyprenyl-6-methoxyphenol hydroxylase-like FAD-dependent oxidoreductase